jgi:hypothetical protein
MPLILGTNSIKDTGYNVANSLRFNDGSSDNLSFSASAGNRKTWTLSGWFKRSHIGSFQRIISSRIDGSNYNGIAFSSDKIQFSEYQGGDTINLVTSRVFRDVSAWYSIIIAVDTTQGTASNRVKFYINGVQETSFSTSTYPSQNLDTVFNSSSTTHRIGTNDDNTGGYYDGYMAEVVFIDGQQLAPDQFGEFDEDSGIWKPIDVSGLTFGTNGFYLDFENSGSLGADVSGNGNNFTVNNLTSIDQTTDTCTNNANTFNILDNINASTFAEGNLKITTASSNTSPNTSTFRMIDGKWYWEIKLAQDTSSGSNEADMIGLTNSSVQSASTNPSSIGINYRGNGRIWNYGGTSETSFGAYASFSTGDIIMVAVDLTDATTGKLYFGVNGTWGNSGNPSTGANSYDFTKGTEPWGASVTCFNSGSSAIFEANFGSPPYSISSGNSDGNGYGNFEYAVPSGYYALNTKNLAEYG